MTEFPGNRKIMFCLASLLYNAGYVRCGEHHLTNEEGYDIYNTEKHQSCGEWMEAIKLYEKLLSTMEIDELRYASTEKLMQLYLNMGFHEKAAALAESAPSMTGCREFLLLKACDGKERAEGYSKMLLETISICADLMLAEVDATHTDSAAAIQRIQNSIQLFSLVCPEEISGIYNKNIEWQSNCATF